jgi:hypothetical protein
MNIIAGQALYAELEAERTRLVSRTEAGYNSADLCRWQERKAGRGIVGAQVVESNYGYSVRYDSGLQNWGLLRPSRGAADTSRQAAVEFCIAWVAADPAHRYAWE